MLSILRGLTCKSKFKVIDSPMLSLFFISKLKLIWYRAGEGSALFKYSSALNTLGHLAVR